MLAESSIKLYDKSLLSWKRFVKRPLIEARNEDLDVWFKHMKKKYKPGTIVQYHLHLKHVYTEALVNSGLGEKEAARKTEDLFDRMIVKDLNRQANKQNALRDKLVTPEEFKTLLKNAKHPRVQAIIAVLYDSACRKGEILSLRLRDLEFRETHALIRVRGKTGERTIPLRDSIPYLRAWLAVHPERGNLNAPLFAIVTGGRLKAMGTSSLNERIRVICEKNGLRPLHPHMLRHTRLTELASAGLGELVLKNFAGWTPSSRMASKYIHMSGKSHVPRILELMGVPIEAEVRNGFKLPKLTFRCPNCDSSIGLNMLHCPTCGYILDDNLRVEKSSEVERLRARVSDLEKSREEMIQRFEKMIELKLGVLDNQSHN
jgi:integrase